MLHKDPKQLVFLGRQLHLDAVELHQPSHEVDAQRIELEHRFLTFRLEPVTEGGLHEGDQLVHAEWFGDVIVGAEFESLDLAGFVATA